MTQALNLANFANNLNTSGATSNAGLQNSAVTVTAGTGLSGGGAVSLGGSVSLANAGVTSLTAGTGISLSGSTGAVTVSTSGASGTVTSVATGNGLQGGTITTSGTLSVAAPGFNTVGSYALGQTYANPNSATLTINSGSDYSAGAGQGQFKSMVIGNVPVNNLSGTWRYMGASFSRPTFGGCCALTYCAIICRVS